jgi:hypothetical protein
LSRQLIPEGGGSVVLAGSSAQRVSPTERTKRAPVVSILCRSFETDVIVVMQDLRLMSRERRRVPVS